ncbi:hypothetical protein ONR57_02900 [Hoyosella sp. YIM 151337]|uniref:hypothetical protein n=1 Tax=Hoyosella sp. YIM 151337 TaxID=2992742 RepID=UPI0022365167|nr:hypothetical protein [Hoyosella sp. YIM 151337]MCW4352243.1 hypothetical protein [Hoyosella sp. YIM 151337]
MTVMRRVAVTWDAADRLEGELNIPEGTNFGDYAALLSLMAAQLHVDPGEVRSITVGPILEGVEVARERDWSALLPAALKEKVQESSVIQAVVTLSDVRPVDLGRGLITWVIKQIRPAQSHVDNEQS